MKSIIYNQEKFKIFIFNKSLLIIEKFINMRKNEIIIEEDQEIKSLSKEELLLYKYLTEENNQIIKSDLNSQITKLQKIEESSPKIDENKEKELNNEIQKYFKAKNKSNNVNNNIIYSIDDLYDEKINLEKSIKEKKEAKELLKQLKALNELKDNEKINTDIIDKIKSNNILSKNQYLMQYISKLKINQVKKENDNLTEEQKILCSFRNLIKTSFIEAKNKDYIETNIMNLLKEFNLENFDLKKIMKENEENNEDEYINNFLSIINITSTFNIFLKELHKYNPYDNILDDKKSKIFYKIIFLLISIYENYSLNIDDTDNNKIIFTLILAHNNLEYMTYLLNYYILFYSEQKNIKQENIENLNNSTLNAVIKIKNLSVSLFSQVVADFSRKLMEIMEGIQSFEDVGKENIFNIYIKKIQDSIKMIFDFFEKLRTTALNREVIFYFNNVLTIYFDSLNQKILLVDTYGLEDINGLLNISQEILKNMKSNFENISNKDMNLSVKFMNNLEQNMEYLKFQEFLFILNSNLKQIKNYLISKNNTIYIRKNQFIKLLNATFNKSEKLDELIDIINTKVKEKNNLN